MKTLRVFMPENIPSLNKGELGILNGMLDSLQALGEVSLTVLSDHPESDNGRYPSNVRTVSYDALWRFSGNLDNPMILRVLTSFAVMIQHLAFALVYRCLGSKAGNLMKSDICKSYANADVILANHDGIFGLGGSRWMPVFFYPIFLPFFSRMLHKPVVFYGGSVSPPRRIRKIAHRIYGMAIANFNLVTLREKHSLDYIERIGIDDNHVFLTADMAFLVTPTSAPRVLDILREEGLDERRKGAVIGVTLTREMACAAFPHLGDEGSYRRHNEVFAEVLDRLADGVDDIIVILPHCIGYGRDLDDRLVARDVRSLCRNKHRIVVVCNEYDARELKGIISTFDALIGERIHSVINASSAGIPSVAISKSTDIRLGIVRMMGEGCTVYHLESINADTLHDAVQQIRMRKEEIREKLFTRAAEVRRQALMNGLLLKAMLQTYYQEA